MFETIEPNDARQTVEVENEIDIWGLLFKLLDKWYVVVLSAVLCAGIAGAYSFFVATPMYEATARMYVTNTSAPLINLSDLQIGNYLTNDYKEVFGVWEVHEQVKNNLNLSCTASELSKMLTVTNPSETRILNLTVKSPDPRLSAAVANEYAKVAKEYIAKTMATEGPNLMSAAVVPESPVSPRKSRNILIGAFIGAAIAAGIIALLFVLDDKLKTAEDLQRYAGLPTFAVIPVTEALAGASDGVSKRRERAQRRPTKHERA